MTLTLPPLKWRPCLPPCPNVYIAGLPRRIPKFGFQSGSNICKACICIYMYPFSLGVICDYLCVGPWHLRRWVSLVRGCVVCRSVCTQVHSLAQTPALTTELVTFYLKCNFLREIRQCKFVFVNLVFLASNEKSLPTPGLGIRTSCAKQRLIYG